jgi:hypothetical protein
MASRKVLIVAISVCVYMTALSSMKHLTTKRTTYLQASSPWCWIVAIRVAWTNASLKRCLRTGAVLKRVLNECE